MRRTSFESEGKKEEREKIRRNDSATIATARKRYNRILHSDK